jgi:hypothetical protein
VSSDGNEHDLDNSFDAYSQEYDSLGSQYDNFANKSVSQWENLTGNPKGLSEGSAYPSGAQDEVQDPVDESEEQEDSSDIVEQTQHHIPNETGRDV